ncbi:hypothetical protein DPMN_024260 [Dreissena polymorpha]|uniref:Uncharacterized protein n=1 Tax=Dreissena polymorpha TaxID=45954 RepID=A0A9D4LPG0_DREPO|nr:hypothetical protein DPMN_024260 [Dreissena polymorpha]
MGLFKLDRSTLITQVPHGFCLKTHAYVEARLSVDGSILRQYFCDGKSSLGTQFSGNRSVPVLLPPNILRRTVDLHRHFADNDRDRFDKMNGRRLSQNYHGMKSSLLLKNVCSEDDDTVSLTAKSPTKNDRGIIAYRRGRRGMSDTMVDSLTVVRRSQHLRMIAARRVSVRLGHINLLVS